MRFPETRPSLILKLQGERNELAWREFVAAYEPFLRRLVARQGVPDRHVPDVCQQVLAAIARSVDSWTPDGREESFRRWLQRVARNVVIRFMTRERKQAGGQGGTELVQQLLSVPEAADPATDRAYEMELILWAAEQVKADFRETSWRAFWKTVIEHQPVDEVAKELNLSSGSIYMSRSRIMARIREKLRFVE